MPSEVWPIVTFNGKQCYVVEGFTLIEVDPQGDTYFLVKTPEGGVGAVGPLVKGDPGKHTIIMEEIDYTFLDADDVTPDSAEFVEITPGDDNTSQVVQLKITVHRGPDGAPGDTVLDVNDFETDPIAGMVITVNSTGDGFDLSSPKIGDRYFPASIANVPSGQSTYTLAQVSIPGQLFDWRPEVHGSCEITGTGPDVKVDLVARLGTTGISNAEIAGNEVGRGFGVAGQYPPTPVFIPGPPTGSSNTFDRVLAGAPAIIYFRTERQTGIDTYTTSASRTRLWVKVNAIP